MGDRHWGVYRAIQTGMITMPYLVETLEEVHETKDQAQLAVLRMYREARARGDVIVIRELPSRSDVA